MIIQIVDFAIPADYKVKLKESKKKDKYLDLARELKKLWNMKVTVIPIFVIGMLNSHQRIDKGTGQLGNKRTSEDHPNNSVFKISQNTEKSPGNLQETCCHSNSSEKPSANAGVKNSH